MYRRSDIPRRLALAAAVAFLAACSDATAPVAPALPDAPAALAPPTIAMPRAEIIIRSRRETADSITVVFDVTPSGGWFVLGNNAIYFPANSICDPATSMKSYERKEWDAPCRAATSAVRVTARVGKSARSGQPWVDFDAHLRFVPSSDESRWVVMFMASEEARGDAPKNAKVRAQREARYNILWMPVPGAAGVDESRHDPTLKTHVAWEDGFVYRRVKHFSGFQVGVGFAAEGSLPGIGSLGF